MRVQRDGVMPCLSGNLYPLLFIDEASVACGIILDVQHMFIYMCTYMYIYTHIYIYTYEMLSYTRLLVNTPAARSLPFTHSPDVFSFTPLWFWTLSFGPGQHP